MDAEIVYEGVSRHVLRLEPWMLISHLKLLIEKHFGLPTFLQSLDIAGVRDSSSVATAFPSVTDRPTVTVRLATNVPLPLRVCPVSGDPFYISICLQDSVNRVKEEIRRIAGVSPMMQKLVLGQLPLRRCQQLSEVYIPGTGKLELWSPCDFSVSVMVTDIIHLVPISPSDTLDQAIEKIERIADIDCRYRRLRSGESMVYSGADLRALRVRDGTVLSLTDPPQRFLWLRAVGSEAVRVDYSPTDTIADIGNAVKAERRIDCGVKILSKGCVCPDTMKVEDCALVCGQVVDYGSLIVTLRTSLCETVTLAVFPHSPISAIKEAVRARLNLPKFPITLVYEELELLDNFTLSAVHYIEEAPIEVVQSFDQYVWLVSKGKAKVEVDFSQSVHSAFHEFACIEPVEYWCDWKFLRTDLSLTANSVHPGSVIHVIDSSTCRQFAAVYSSESTFYALPTEAESSPLGIRLLQLKLELQSTAKSPAFDPEKELRYRSLPIRAVLSSERYYDFRSTWNAQKTAAVDPLLPVSKVKEMLESEFLVPASQMALVSKGRFLDNDSSLAGIKEGGVVTVCRSCEVSLTIINQSNSVKVVLLESLEITVRQLKSLYHSPPVVLFYKKERLDEERQLGECGIVPGSCIRAATLSDFIVAVPSAGEVESKYAFIWQFGNRVHQIWFDGSEHTRDIMERTGKALGFDCGKIVVLYEGEKFVNNFNFRLRTGRVVQVLGALDEAVVVSSEHSPAVFAAISPLATVNELKARLGLGPANLLCDGKQLKNRSKLQENQITPFSELEEISIYDGVFRVRLIGLSSVSIVQKQSKVITVGALKRRLADCGEPTSRIYVNGEFAQDSALISEHFELLALDHESTCVTVTSLRGSRVSLGFHPSTPVSALREAISANIMIFGPYHSLVYDGKILSDKSRTLEDYGVPAKCSVVISEPDNPFVFMHTKHGRKLVTYPMKLSPDLAKQTLAAQDHTVTKAGELLVVPDPIPADANFPWQLVYCDPGETAVILNPPGSPQSLIVFVPQASTEELWQAVTARTGLTEFRFSGFGELSEGKRMSEYWGVDSVYCLRRTEELFSWVFSAKDSEAQEGQVLRDNSAVAPPQSASLPDGQTALWTAEAVIIIETTEGARRPLKVESTQQVSRVKEAVTAMLRQQVTDLYCSDELLPDGCTLQQCRISPGAIVQALTAHDCRLVVRFSLSPPLALYIRKSSVVSEVKCKVAETIKLSELTFRLCCHMEFPRGADFSFLPHIAGYYMLNIYFPLLASDEVLLMVEDAPHFPVPIIASVNETIGGVRKRAEQALRRQVKSLMYGGGLLPELCTVQQSGLSMLSKVTYF